jgi:hypothetical protein
LGAAATNQAVGVGSKKEAEPVTGSEAIRELLNLQEYEDREKAHFEADEILCELLSELGYGEVIKAWNMVPKYK